MTYLEEYATQVLDGKIIACDKIKREYEHLLDDLYKPGEFHFDEKIGNRPIEFMERFCKQSKGALGKPLKLELFQKAQLNALFGFVDDNNLRRFREMLEVIARKNGKTTKMAGIELYCATADKEGGAECYNVATARDQALIGYGECANMVRQSPLLRKHWRKRVSDLYSASDFSVIKALSVNTNSLDGLNTHFGGIDELAAIKNRDLYDLIKQSTSSRRQPLICEITTNGFVRNGIFDAQYEYASKVIYGEIDDKRFLPIIYELDDVSEWDNPKMWIKADPGLGTIKSREQLADNVAKAKNDASFKPTVLVKDFNMKQNSANAWMTFEEINNEQTFDMDEMGFRYGIGGIDAADSVDLFAAKMICKRQDDPNIYVMQMYWIPSKKIEEMKTRQNKDDAPYELWASQGLIRIVEGNKVNKQEAIDWFCELRDEHDIYPLYIGYDPWHMDDLTLSRFEQEFGRNVMIPVRQGVHTLSQPMKDMKADYQAKRVIYNNNPIGKYCLLNTYAKTDINGNIQPEKGQSQYKRIDGTAAELDAMVILAQKGEEYESLI